MKNIRKLIILSGLSGSGKTIALHTLEDSGYFCVDNLPVRLLPSYVQNIQLEKSISSELIAVSIDARSGIKEKVEFEKAIELIKTLEIDTEIIVLSTETNILLSRFSETRRKHPLSRQGVPLIEAIELEKIFLEPILEFADLIIDTSDLNIHQLRHQITNRVATDDEKHLALLFQSFGFKHGLPSDTDFIFDVRCLPNPHWEPELKDFTGRDQPVIDFLSSHQEVEEIFNSISKFLLEWIPKFETENRSYVTVSIGCTGGKHRSVYIVERLNNFFSKKMNNVSMRHKELNSSK